MNFLPILMKKPALAFALRACLNTAIAMVIGLGTSAHGTEPLPSRPLPPSSADNARGSLKVSGKTPADPDVNVQFETKLIDATDEPAELEKALATDAETVIVSSDETEVLIQAAKASGPGAKNQIYLLPMGKAIRPSADQPGGINQLLRRSGLYLVNTFKRDKIGVSIATFTLANEIVRWVHVSTASNFVITSNIVYTILWSTFFLNKDTWSKVTKPIQATYRKLFKLSEIIPQSAISEDLAIKFVAGLSLSMALNGVRAGLVGIDQLARGVFDPLNLSMPLLMGAVMTAVGFSWSEMVGAINEDHYPRSKKILRLVMNTKSCLISYFAASAMLMNPEHYGFSPWIAVTLSGITGLVFYANVNKFLPSIEARTARRCEAMFTSSDGVVY